MAYSKNDPTLEVREENLEEMLHRRPELNGIAQKMQSLLRLLMNNADPDDTSQKIVILCGAHHNGIAGSKQAKCSCGAVVWYSPATQQVMTAHKWTDIVLLCPRCLDPTIKELEIAQTKNTPAN